MSLIFFSFFFSSKTCKSTQTCLLTTFGLLASLVNVNSFLCTTTHHGKRLNELMESSYLCVLYCINRRVINLHSIVPLWYDFVE